MISRYQLRKRFSFCFALYL